MIECMTMGPSLLNDIWSHQIHTLIVRRELNRMLIMNIDGTSQEVVENTEWWPPEFNDNVECNTSAQKNADNELRLIESKCSPGWQRQSTRPSIHALRLLFDVEYNCKSLTNAQIGILIGRYELLLVVYLTHSMYQSKCFSLAIKSQVPPIVLLIKQHGRQESRTSHQPSRNFRASHISVPIYIACILRQLGYIYQPVAQEYQIF